MYDIILMTNVNEKEWSKGKQIISFVFKMHLIFWPSSMYHVKHFDDYLTSVKKNESNTIRKFPLSREMQSYSNLCELQKNWQKDNWMFDFYADDFFIYPERVQNGFKWEELMQM